MRQRMWPQVVLGFAVWMIAWTSLAAIAGVTVGCLPSARCAPGDDTTCPDGRVCATDGRCVLPSEREARDKANPGEGGEGEGGEGEGGEGEGDEGGEGEGAGEEVPPVGHVDALGEWRRTVILTHPSPIFGVGGAHRLGDGSLRIGVIRLGPDDALARAHVVSVDRVSGDIDDADLGVVGAASSAPTLVDDADARAVVTLSMGLLTRWLGWDLDDAPPRPLRLEEEQDATADVAPHVCDDEFGRPVLVYADYQAVRARTIDDVAAPGAPQVLASVDASDVDCAGRLAAYLADGRLHVHDLHGDEEVWSVPADALFLHATRDYTRAVFTVHHEGRARIAMFDGASLDVVYDVGSLDGDVVQAVPYARNGRRGAVVQIGDSRDLELWEVVADASLAKVDVVEDAGFLVQVASAEDLFVTDGDVLAWVHPG